MDLDNQDIQPTPVDRFENSESYSEVSHINTQRDYVVVGGEKIAFPECLKDTLIQKLLILKAEWSEDWNATSQHGFQSQIRRVFVALADIKITEEKFCMQQISTAIIKAVNKSEKTAYGLQCIFNSLLNTDFLKRSGVSHSERILALEIKKHYRKFKKPTNEQRPSLCDLYPSFGTDDEYVESIRKTAFVLHETLSEMRQEFALHMKDERDELIAIFKNRPDLRTGNHFGWFHHKKVETDKERDRCLEIIHQAALTLATSGKKNKHLLECLFLGHCYGTDFLERGVTYSEEVGVSLADGITQEHMASRVQHALDRLRNNLRHALSDRYEYYDYYYKGSKRRGKRLSKYTPAVPHPLILLIPFTWFEMQMYSYILLTERANPDSVQDFDVDDIEYFDTAGNESSSKDNRATGLRLFKGRSGKTKTLIYNKHDPIYRVFNDIRSSYRGALEDGLIDENYKKPFALRGKVGLSKGGLYFTTLKGSALAPLIVSGTSLSDHVEASGYVAWIRLLKWCAPRTSSPGRGHNSPPFDVDGETRDRWFTSSNLSQSAVKAAQLMDLSLPVATSDNLRHPLSQEYWEELADNAQFHAKATRLNTYFIRNQSEKVTEILNDFAARHGEAQVELAEKLKSIMGSVELLDHKTASAALGLSESPHQRSVDDMLAESKAVDAITDTGFFKTADSAVTYIIKSPRTAALMMAKMNHIDSNYDDLCITNPNLVVAAVATRMMLAAVLENFSEKDRSDAKLLIDSFAKDPDRSPFKFPDLAVSLGGFE